MTNETLLNYNLNIKAQLDSITQPFLKAHGLHHFTYQRFLPDGRHISLFNNLEWGDFFLKNLNTDGESFSGFISTLSHTDFDPRLWPRDTSDSLLNAMFTKNVWNGISVYRFVEDGLEAFEFGTLSSNENALQFYLVNLPLLKQFSAFLSLKLHEILYPTDIDCYGAFNKKFGADIVKSKTQQNRRNFGPLKQCYTENGLITFSQQESACLNLLVKGFCAKRIANKLMLSPKTVEEYIAKAKKKAGVHKSSQLTSLLNGDYCWENKF